MKLSALLRGLEGVTVLRGGQDLERDIAAVRDDSRAVAPGDLFVAIAGTVQDGRRFIVDAAARGAVALVAEQDEPGFVGTMIVAEDARWTLGELVARSRGAASALVLSAVTGTNGKTTTTYLLEAMLEASGRRAGVIGTVTYRVRGGKGVAGVARPELSRAAPLTTPNAVLLHDLFHEMREAGAEDVVLEASSIALVQGRLAGCTFRVAGFTNLTQDHLDYHGTMERYFEAKRILFERLLDPVHGVAVVPVDQEAGRTLREAFLRRGGGGSAGAGGGGRLLGVATTPGTKHADVAVVKAELGAHGSKVDYDTPLGRLEITTPLVGDYNLSNLTLAVGMGIGRGLGAEAIVAGAAATHGVPGRLERVPNERGVLCVVDYAHTPDGVVRALQAVRPFVAPQGRLIVVFGCGGDRDRAKRPVMGEMAMRHADLVLVTSDNPRTEEPGSIIEMILAGVKRVGVESRDVATWGDARRGYDVQPDRRTAVAAAVAASRRGDVLVLAGKGHEDYQIIGTTKFPFDDRLLAAALFAGEPARVVT